MNPREKILKIETDLGMSSAAMARAMKVTAATYRNKKSDKNMDHSFNEKNYRDLVDFLKEYVLTL